MPMNCLRPRRAARPKSRPLSLLFLLDGRAGDHGDVLCAYPVGRALGNALHRLLRADKRQSRPTFEIMPLGGGERGTGMVPLAVVDDATPKTREGVGVCPTHPG